MLAQAQNISGKIQRKLVKLVVSWMQKRGTGIWDGTKTDLYMHIFYTV